MARQTFYFSDGPYLQAMQGLHSALSGTEAFVKFIGLARTGKSGVCEKLTQFMRLKDYRVLYFDYPIESPDMLRSLLAKELDIPDTYNMLRHLEDALVGEAEKPLVIVFDDAHLMSDITLIEIYRLAGVQIADKRVINIVLCGEPELERRLSSKQEFTSLLQHVSHNFLLEPMNAETSYQFLEAYLDKMGLSGVQLEPAARNQFYKSCKGFPGPAYSLCELVATIRRDDQEQLPISKEELLLAIRNADSEQPVPSSGLRDGNRWMLFGPLGAVVVIASLAFLLRQLGPVELPNDSAGPANLMVDGQIEAGTDVVSPFAVDELAASVADDSSATIEPVQLESAARDQSSPEPQTAQALQELPAVEVEPPVSDSSLALVTAQERGISNEVIAEPLFEQLAADIMSSNEVTEPTLSVVDESASPDEVVPLSNVTLTRPMLALDDEDIEALVVEAAEEAPIEETENLESVLETTPSSAAVPSIPSELISAESTEQSPQQVVQNWLNAWEGQDLESYFSSYDAGFVPRYHSSKSLWQSNRERVIGNASQITLEMSDFVLISEDAESIEVHFWLAYRSPTYRDNTRKKLVLKKLPADESGANKLLILEEINLEVRV